MTFTTGEKYCSEALKLALHLFWADILMTRFWKCQKLLTGFRCVESVERHAFEIVSTVTLLVAHFDHVFIINHAPARDIIRNGNQYNRNLVWQNGQRRADASFIYVFCCWGTLTSFSLHHLPFWICWTFHVISSLLNLWASICFPPAEPIWNIPKNAADGFTIFLPHLLKGMRGKEHLAPHNQPCSILITSNFLNEQIVAKGWAEAGTFFSECKLKDEFWDTEIKSTHSQQQGTTPTKKGVRFTVKKINWAYYSSGTVRIMCFNCVRWMEQLKTLHSSDPESKDDIVQEKMIRRFPR